MEIRYLFTISMDIYRELNEDPYIFANFSPVGTLYGKLGTFSSPLI